MQNKRIGKVRILPLFSRSGIWDESFRTETCDRIILIGWQRLKHQIAFASAAFDGCVKLSGLSLPGIFYANIWLGFATGLFCVGSENLAPFGQKRVNAE
jgi:hypothetical protein